MPQNMGSLYRFTKTGQEPQIVALHDHGGQSINTASAVGRMFLTMLAGFAEFERGLIRERTKAALATKKSRGEAVSGPTLGFDRDGDRLVENAAEQARCATSPCGRPDGTPFFPAIQFVM